MLLLLTVNIENPLTREYAARMLEFVKLLTQKLRSARPDGSSMVVWYDALTTEGTLQHQNGLNSLNDPFFQAADAIFLNYFWRPNVLQVWCACYYQCGFAFRFPLVL